MSDNYLPSLGNKLFKKKYITPNKIIKSITEGKRDNRILSEDRYAYTEEHNSLANTINLVNKSGDNHSSKIYPNKGNILLKEFIRNKTIMGNKNINPNKIKFPISLINNKAKSIRNSNRNNRNANISNYYSDYYINESSNKHLYLNSKDNKNSYNLNISNKERKEDFSIEVNKIMDSLIHKEPIDENKNKYRKIQKKKIKFPKEKSIDPINYIKYNLQKNPFNKKLYKGYNTIMKIQGKTHLKEDYENNMIKKASDIYSLKLDSDHLDAPLDEAKKYKKSYEDLIKDQTRTYKSFNFNRNKKSPQIKKVNPYQKLLDNNYKIYFNKKFNLTKENSEKMHNKTKMGVYFEKNIEKYISFDKRLNNILMISRNNEENACKKSKEHEKMLDKIDILLNAYLKYK